MPAERDAEALERARGVTRNQLGSAVADKASDAFCAAVAAAAAPQAHAVAAFSILESVAPPQAHGTPHFASVVELAEPETPPARLPESVSAKAAGAVRAALEGVTGLPEAEKSLALLLRQAGIKSARDEFLRSYGTIRDTLDSGAATVAAGRPAGAREAIGSAAAPVQTCWLNRTVRATTDPGVLSEVAADPGVLRLDLPRRIMPDATITMDSLMVAAGAVRQGGGPTGAGVSVGVIDQEVSAGHPALRDRVVHRRNYTQEPFGTPGPHGTAVAGIIAASGDGYEGVAPAAEIHSYKVMGRVPPLNATDFEGAVAIQNALEDGLRVVNCSWGNGPATGGNSREARACNNAWDLGLTIVKSAGNYGPSPSSLTTPAEAEGVIVVGGCDSGGTELGRYSSRGPTRTGAHRPHLIAPGGLDDKPLEGLDVAGGHGRIGNGTSFATPHVAGLVALLLEREPDLLPGEQRDRLLAACTKLADLPEDAQGAGVVDPRALFGA